MTKDENEQKSTGNGDEVTAVENSANAIVKNYMYWSMGSGLIPFAVLDLAAIVAVQLKMLSRLSDLYEVKFSENQGKSIIAALTGTLGAHALRRSAFTGFLKSIPILGLVGMFAMPIYAGAVTYAIGKVFIQHFESGGTFLDFDPAKVKEYFSKLYEEGRTAASKLKKEKA
jgi:uncharacterized protein (DUF697 family)